MPEINLKELSGYSNELARVRNDFKNTGYVSPLEAMSSSQERAFALTNIGAVLRFGEPFSTETDMRDVQSGRVEYVTYLYTLPKI